MARAGEMATPMTVRASDVHGEAHGEKRLAVGNTIAMRMWTHEAQGTRKDERRREYETVGYVLEGRAELDVEGRRFILEKGTSYLVPQGAEHSYRILERFTAVEATHPIWFNVGEQH